MTPETSWIDVGCGRELFPSNRPLAKRLSERAKLLVEPSGAVPTAAYSVHGRELAGEVVVLVLSGGNTSVDGGAGTS